MFEFSVSFNGKDGHRNQFGRFMDKPLCSLKPPTCQYHREEGWHEGEKTA
jgi:hypothetical protein